MRKFAGYFTKSEITYWGGLLFIALASVVFLRYITPYGLGLINDSVGYIGGARSLLAGNGYSRLTGDWISVPITNYPPMYSIILAAIGLSGLEIVRATRLLNMLCIAANVVLVGVSVRTITRSKVFGLMAALLFVISEPFIWIHTFAITEPLYLLLNMMVILLFSMYLENNKAVLIILAGLITSLAFLTRLVGLSIYGCIILSILVFLPGWKKKLRAGGLFLASSLPGAAVWAVRNAIVAGNPSNRTLNYNPISDYKIQEGVGNFWSWIFPNQWIVINDLNSVWVYLSALVFCVLLLWTSIMLWRNFSQSIVKKREEIDSSIVVSNSKQDQNRQYYKMVFIYMTQGLVYLLLLVFTLMFLDSSPIFEHRILSPFYLSLFIAGMALPAWMWKTKRTVMKVACVATLVLAGGFAFVDTVAMAQWLNHTGQGFVSLTWRKSATVEVVRELPEVTLISNRPTALYLLAERPAYALLAPVDAASREERPGYWENIEIIRESILNHEAMLVIFNYQGYLDNPEESWWMERVTEGLPLYGEYWDGAIFGLAH